MSENPTLLAQILQALAASEERTTDRLMQLATDMRGLRDGLHELRGEVTELRAEVLSLRVETMARMDRLQNSMSTLRDDLRVTQASSETVLTHAVTTRADLRSLTELVFAMQRKINALDASLREVRGEP